MFSCVLCHFPIWCPFLEVILSIDRFLIFAVCCTNVNYVGCLFYMQYPKKLRITFNIFILYVVVKTVGLWKSQILDKRTLISTCVRVTVNKSIDKLTFTQAKLWILIDRQLERSKPLQRHKVICCEERPPA